MPSQIMSNINCSIRDEDVLGLRSVSEPGTVLDLLWEETVERDRGRDRGREREREGRRVREREKEIEGEKE